MADTVETSLHLRPHGREGWDSDTIHRVSLRIPELPLGGHLIIQLLPLFTYWNALAVWVWRPKLYG